ncbi:MAG: BatD family protein, partial [Bacteriovorax sp.]|nr:BatD family protein [Bacteriovorax sp.]
KTKERLVMNLLKIVFVTFLFLIIPALRAEDIDVEVSPPEPLMNESFFVSFKIKTTGNVEPYISFTPSGAVVQGKREQGVSISTTVINGKFTTSREQSYVYELIAEHQGQVTLRNIKVEIGGKVTNVKDVHVNVLAQAKKLADAFMEATASKTKVYLGEAIDVNYYLYFKTSISANDVKEFPKLNKFIKRFHHINAPVETVQYKGQVFKRILAYSAKLFAEKIGNAVLDPMTISVQIIENDYNSPFGGFGMGSQHYKNKDLASPRIEVEVLPLPAENVPAGFTGLVGEHEFNLSVAKTKYLVNEPIEVKLEVKGKGALENMDAPAIYTDNSLEQFDTKSEVTELGVTSAKKLFEYTYLARGPLNIKARELSLSYFDPNSGKYVEKKITVPGIEVSGVAASSADGASTGQGQSANKDQSNTPPESDFLSKLFSSDASSKKIDKNTIGLVGPAMSGQGRWFERWFDLVNMALALIIMSLLGKWYFDSRNSKPTSGHQSTEVKKLIAQMKSKGLNYSELYKVITVLDRQNKMASGGVSIFLIIEESHLSVEAKSYFKNALLVCEEKAFGIDRNDKKIEFKGNFFKEILKLI